MLLFFAVLFVSVTTFADEWVYVRPEVGLGFTDNVYQDDENKKSDAFLWAQALARYGLSDADLVGKINLTHFTKESANDSVSYYLKYITPLTMPKTDLSVAVGGFSYFKTDVGSTEEAFTNAYVTTFVTRSFRSSLEFEYALEPGVKFSSYPQLANRFDTQAYFRADGYWAAQKNTEVNPYAEIGFIFSNRGYYSRSYIDLGCSLTQTIDSQYKVNGDVFLRSSSYPNRRVSDILLNPNRAGRATSKSFDTNEAISLTQISASLIRTDGEQDLSLGFSYARETSLSQLTGYKEMQITASAKWNF